ncbi:MAG: PadR family transcriptional regulator [Oscillospiraceae bacterium]|nr:PadR family transcriptional regulator [Oscillospiraceae bacterium]
MDPQLKRGLLDVCVLSVLRREDSYGYQIIKDLSGCIEISESTLYPILRRLEGGGCLTVYTVEHGSRLRKFYHITPEGVKVIDQFLESWPEIQRVYDLIKECAGDDTSAVSQ